MFQDEARFCHINDVRRCGAPMSLRPLCQGMLTREFPSACTAVSVLNGKLDSLKLPHVNTPCMQLLLSKAAARNAEQRILMVLDDSDWHDGAESWPESRSTAAGK